MKYIAVLIFTLLLTGCATPFVQHELMPTSQLVAAYIKPIQNHKNSIPTAGIDSYGYLAMTEAQEHKLLDAASIDVFKNGMSPSKSVIYFSRIMSYGQAGISKDLFEREIINESKRLGAQVVYIYNSSTNLTGSVNSYYGSLGLSVSQNTYTNQYFALAGIYAKSTAGLITDIDGNVVFISPSSPAESAGLTEGDKIIAINGIYFKKDPFVIDREIKSKYPGSTVTFTILDKQFNKRQVKLTLIEEQ